MCRKLLILGILATALGVRLAAGMWWQGRLPPGAKFAFPDSESYWKLAERIARAQPYQFGPDRRVFRTPGYPLLLAPLFWLAHGEPPVMWARALNAVLGVGAVGGVMVLANRLFDPRAAILAGAAAAVYPGAIATSVFVLSEAPFCPFMIAHLLLWTLAWQAGDNRRRQAYLALSAGLVAGAATLMRPSWLLFVPFAVCVAVGAALWAVRGERKAHVVRHLFVGGWMMIGLVLAMMPWWIRNGRVTGRFVPTTLQVGESLYDGWNPEATGASDMRFVDRFRRQLRREEAEQGGQRSGEASFEQRLDRRMRDAALAWARNHPGRVLRLAGVKFLRIWNVWPNEPSLQSTAFCIIVMLGYVPLLLLGLCGAVRFARRGWPYVLCFLPAVYLTCLHMVFVGSIRYRQPAMLPLIVLAAGFVGRFGRGAKPA